MKTKFLEKIALVIASAAKQSMTAILATAACLLLFAACESENKGKYNPPDTSDTSTTTRSSVRYRGVNLNENAISEADFQRLAGWGVNHVRWNFVNWTESYHNGNQTVDEYLGWVTQNCDTLESRLPFLEAAGITVNINLHHPPGGRNENSVMRLFLLPELQTAFVEGWKIIAERFKDSKVIVCYDLLNEPSDYSVGPSCKDNRELQIATADAIREIDTAKKFIFEQRGDLYGNFQPLPGNDWIYSIHVYTPHVVTHQGILDDCPLGVSYPGNLTLNNDSWPDAPSYWNKATLRQYLNEVQEVFLFVKKNNVEIYVGEFGCARWAPNNSAYNYIRDCIEIFEAEDWHWIYFTDYPYASTNFGANGWSVQYNEVYRSPNPVSEPTGRLLLLQEYWALNGK